MDIVDIEWLFTEYQNNTCIPVLHICRFEHYDKFITYVSELNHKTQCNQKHDVVYKTAMINVEYVLHSQNKPQISPHDDVIKWKHFPRYWPFVRGIHRSSVNSPHKGQWRDALLLSLICVWINGWVKLVIWDTITPIMTSLYCSHQVYFASISTDRVFQLNPLPPGDLYLLWKCPHMNVSGSYWW